jgi:hypothetical protein
MERRIISVFQVPSAFSFAGIVALISVFYGRLVNRSFSFFCYMAEGQQGIYFMIFKQTTLKGVEPRYCIVREVDTLE